MIVHTFSVWEASREDDERHRFARDTWCPAYASGLVKMNPVPVSRAFDDGQRRLPFVKDVIRDGFNHGDTVCLTNSDICAAQDIAELLTSFSTPAHARRRDFANIDHPLSVDEIATGELYPGSDLYLIPRDWWKRVEPRMPDMVLGAEGLDAVMRVLVNESGGHEIHNRIYHKRHESHWLKHRICPANLHNLRLGWNFMLETFL